MRVALCGVGGWRRAEGVLAGVGDDIEVKSKQESDRRRGMGFDGLCAGEREAGGCVRGALEARRGVSRSKDDEVLFKGLGILIEPDAANSVWLIAIVCVATAMIMLSRYRRGRRCRTMSGIIGSCGSGGIRKGGNPLAAQTLPLYSAGPHK